MMGSNEDTGVDALAQIRALCDRYHAMRWGWDEIRAILDAAPMAATPPQGIDRDALLAVLRKHGGYDKQEAADEILALVRPVAATPPQGIDRIALKQELKFWVTPNFIDRAADRILALARPVEGVVLSREEARIVLDVLRIVGWDGRLSDQSVSDEVQRLVAHLETVEKES